MSAGESISGSSYHLLSGADALHQAVTAAHAFSAAHDVQGKYAARLAIVVEELVTNLLEHGGVDGEAGIELMLSRDEGVRIVLTDPGAPFDLRSHNSDEPIPDRGGGAGIDLIQAWTRILAYGSESGRNRIELWMPVADEAR
ncbi:MAG: anti-sigma regulatory factor [Rhizorhabdus sp.]|nr:anti-sigma regulatory factor [Rhizorhabdus sp.]